MIDNTKRLNFLRDKYNVIDCDDVVGIRTLKLDYEERGYDCQTLQNYNNLSEAAIVFSLEIEVFDEGGNKIHKVDDNGNEVIKRKLKVYISNDVFNDVVESDPTKNKMCCQWMLNIFTNSLKKGEFVLAGRFYHEDLPLAKDYLTIFEANKRKNIFKVFSEASYLLKYMVDPTNINQYTSLNQLYDAVDPFIIRDPSEMEKTLNKFVAMGHATIPVRDRRFLVYIPTTLEASVIFDKFVNWCTARPGNSNFVTYRNNKKPNGDESDIYIVIDTRFFTDRLEDKFLFQLHFETDQVRDRKQDDANLYEYVLQHSESLSNYFHEELTVMAKDLGGHRNNRYLNILTKFGWTEAMFDVMEYFTTIIDFDNLEIPRLPNISRFTMLDNLILTNCGLVTIDESIGKLKTLELISLPNNRITVLPKEIGNLKNLVYLNLKGNEITHIPDEIKYLDKSNGGSLYGLSVDRTKIGNVNYNKLIELLPETIINKNDYGI